MHKQEKSHEGGAGRAAPGVTTSPRSNIVSQRVTWCHGCHVSADAMTHKRAAFLDLPVVVIYLMTVYL